MEYFNVLPSEITNQQIYGKDLFDPDSAIEVILILEQEFKAEFVQFVFQPRGSYAIMKRKERSLCTPLLELQLKN